MNYLTAKTRLAGSLSLILWMGYGTSAMAQAGVDSFVTTTSALAGSVTCSNGTVTPISVDASTTNDSGSNESTAGTTTVTACGQTIYQASSIDDKSHADDTVSQDDSTGETDAQNVSLLGGLVTYSQEQAQTICQPTDANGDVGCTGVATFTGLTIDGNLLPAGATTPGETYPIVNAQVLAPDCVGVALFTGKVVLLDSQIVNNNTPNVTGEGEWIHVTGSATCLGLPLGATTHYDLRDDNFNKLMNFVQMKKTFCFWNCPQPTALALLTRRF